jgi:hypothetical protein
LLSDVYTSAGLQPPLFSLLQLGHIDSPLGPSGVKVPWTDVARHMYTNGYDLRHFFTMGITPGVVSAIIRGCWVLNRYATGGSTAQRKMEHAKLTSMLLLGHSVATSGTLLKTGLIYGMNPAALNYNPILAMAPPPSPGSRKLLPATTGSTVPLRRNGNHSLPNPTGNRYSASR